MPGEKNKGNENNSVLQSNIVILILIAIAVLIFISLIGLCGIVGVGVRYVLFGFLGLPAFAFPFVLVIGFFMCNKFQGSSTFTKRVIGIIGFYALVCALCQIVMAGFTPGYSVLQAFVDSAKDHLGGGLIGGCIVQLLGSLIGVVGTYIVLIIGLFIFAILFSQEPIVSRMSRNTKDAYQKARDRAKQRRAELEEEEAGKDEFDDEEEHSMVSSRRKTLFKDTLLEKPDQKGSEPEGEDIFDAYINGKARGNTDRKEFSRDPEDVPLPPIDIPEDYFEIKEETSQNAQNTQIIDLDSNIPYEMQSSSRELPDDDTEISDVNGTIPENMEEIVLPGTDEETSGEETSDLRTPGEKQDIIQKPKPKKRAKKAYRLPSVDLLNKGETGSTAEFKAQVRETAEKLQNTFNNFGVDAAVVGVSCGPSVTRYEIQPAQGVKVKQIVNLADDIKLNLAAADIRIEAPIPGKSAIGIEVPNKTIRVVALSELIGTTEFRNSRSKLTITVGKDLSGKTIVSDIAKMPHLLIAGSTGSGKSVCVNTFIMSILYKAKPDEVKFIMIDPKVVELQVYRDIPHLICPVVTDKKKAAGALQWAVAEMEKRYNLFAEFGVRDIFGYNNKVKELEEYAGDVHPQPLPQIVIVIDELAELMMASPAEVEDSICRLAQLSRACGMHMIIATQRPSVNVITGVIKANMPSKIALSVSSSIDSRVIIDMNGAEKLVGKGDMLFYPSGYPKPVRIQGAYVSDEEIENVVSFIKGNNDFDTSESEKVYEQISNMSASISSASSDSPDADDRDVYFRDAGRFIIEKDKASIGMLQRVFKIGFNRAARIMDQLCAAGVVGEEEGTKPRKILMTLEQFENYLEEN